MLICDYNRKYDSVIPHDFGRHRLIVSALFILIVFCDLYQLIRQTTECLAKSRMIGICHCDDRICQRAIRPDVFLIIRINTVLDCFRRCLRRCRCRGRRDEHCHFLRHRLIIVERLDLLIHIDCLRVIRAREICVRILHGIAGLRVDLRLIVVAVRILLIEIDHLLVRIGRLVVGTGNISRL